jgi:hypothetical protein
MIEANWLMLASPSDCLIWHLSQVFANGLRYSFLKQINL